MSANRLFLLAALSLLGLAGALAEVVYDNGPPNDPRVGSEMTHWIQADDFTFLTGTRLEGVIFRDFELPLGFAGSIVWNIYADSGTHTPGIWVAGGTSTNLSHTRTGFPVYGAYEEYLNTFDIAPTGLPAGTYWLALHNGPVLYNVPQNFFYWEATSTRGAIPNHELEAPYTGQWESKECPQCTVPPLTEYAFQLTGVPGARITAITRADRVPKISFTTILGQNYRVEYKNNLSDPSWTSVPGADPVAGTGGVVQISDPDPNAGNLPRRFYRAVLL